MTGNSKEIKKLKHQQAKNREYIERYKKRRKKHLFLMITPIVVYILFNIEGAYKDFGNVFIFIARALSIIIVLTVAYFLGVKYANKKREREIKVIRTKIYHLMKLDND